MALKRLAWTAVAVLTVFLGGRTETRSVLRAHPNTGVAQAQDLLYVCVQDDAKVAVIDMATRQLVRTIDLTTMGYAATAKPHFVAVEPDGSFWYVSLIGENRILKLNRQDEVVGSYETETPGLLSIVPGTDLLAASRSMSAVNPPRRVSLIERSSMDGEEIDVLFPRPHPIAVSDDFVYTGSLGANQIASVNLESYRAQVVSVAGDPHAFVQFTISPDGSKLIASTELTGQLHVYDLADPARPSLERTIDVGPMAFHPTFTRDGRHVWVPVKSSNDIAVIDTSTWTIARRIQSAAFRQPHLVLFSPDGAWAFVSNNNKRMAMGDAAEHADHDMPAMPDVGGPASLLILDTATGEVASSIELGHNLTGMGARAAR